MLAARNLILSCILFGLIYFVTSSDQEEEESIGNEQEALKTKLFTRLESNDVQKLSEWSNLSQVVNSEDSNGKRPLHIATEKNHLGLVKLLIEIGADLDSIYFGTKDDFYQTTALGIAAKEDFTEIAKYLIDKGATFAYDKTSSAHYTSPLHYAIQNNNTELFNLLLPKGSDFVDSKDSEGFTPIFSAVENGNLEIVKKLLDAGVSVGSKNGVGFYTPLYAVSLAKHNIKPMVYFLLDKGANMEQRTLYGGTPLTYALHMKNLEAIEAFIDREPVLNPVWLEKAVVGNQPEIAALLVRGGIDVRLCMTSKKWTEWHLLTFTKLLTVSESRAIHNATIDIQDALGMTALHIAVSNNFLKGVKILVERGANVHIPNFKSVSPIGTSLMKKHFEIMKFLYVNGADINELHHIDKSAYSAAEYAQHSFHKSIPQIIEDELGIKN